MSRKHILAATAAVCIIAAAVAGIWLASQAGRPALIPLTSTAPEILREKELPAGTIVVNASSAMNSRAPMILNRNAPGTDSPFLAVPQSGDNRGSRAKTSLPFTAETARDYHAWARVRWDDSCGNSMLFALNAERPHVIG
jgi:hypothetical protein